MRQPHLYFVQIYYFFVLCPIQRENKFGTHILRADYVDILAVGLNDLTHDGQPQTGTLLVLAAGDVGLVKSVPDLWYLIRRNADAVISDGDKDVLHLPGGGYGDGGVGITEFNGIIQQIVNDLLDFFFVGVYLLRFAAQRENKLDILFLKLDFLGGCDGMNHSVDIENGGLQKEAVVVQAVQCQDILGQMGQTLCLIQNDFQIFILHFPRNRSIQDGLHVSLDGGQGRAEVMGNIRHKFSLVFSGLVDLLCHILKIRLQHRVFVVGAGRQREFQISVDVGVGSLNSFL